MVNKYTYRIEWSEEDKAYIGLCLEFPSLSAFGDDQHEALTEIISVVNFCVEDMRKTHEKLPEPLTKKKARSQTPSTARRRKV